MTPTVVIDVFGQHVDVRASTPLADVLADVLADLAVPAQQAPRVGVLRLDITQDGQGRWSATVDGTPRIRGVDLDSVVEQVLRWVDATAAAHLAPDEVAIRASAIEHHGRIVAITGRTSQRTAVLALWWAQRGASSVGEGLCAVRADGMVRPWPRPALLPVAVAQELGIEVTDGPFEDVVPHRMPRTGEDASSPETATGSMAPLSLVADLRLGREGTPATVMVLDPPAALAHLARNMIGPPGHRRQMFRRLAVLARTVPVVVVTSPGHREAHDALVAHMAQV